METDQLKQYLSRYRQGLLSSEEVQLLMAVVADERNAAIIKEEITAVLESELPDKGWNPDWEAPMLEAIFQHGKTEQPVPSTPVVSIKSRGWWKYVAAALLIIVAGTVTVLQNRKSDPSVATQVIKPGTDKATLTLADGSVVEIDQQRNGMLAQQGGARVIKLDSGALAYEGTGKGASGMNTLTTPRGGQFHVTLPDGTDVWLNSASSLTYPVAFSGDSREVALTGEAYFEVKENKAKPFMVKVRDIQVRVLGTGFNIMSYDEEPTIQTSLVHGAVKVSYKKASSILKPGQQANLSSGSDVFQLREPDMEQVLAWKNGDFNFDGATITTIMRQVARWYDVEVAYEGTVPTREFFGIIPRKENVTQVLQALEMPGTVHFKVEGRKITVIPGPAGK